MELAEAEEVNFGSSLIVPSVQELAKAPITRIPSRYMLPDQESPSIPDSNFLPSLPVIDLQKLGIEDLADSELELLHLACKEWGFFQVINHGINASFLDKFKLDVENFFRLSYEEKQKLWQQPDNHQGFGQLFVVSEEQKLDWSDMFYITTLPHTLRRADLFDKLPPSLRETVEVYSLEVKRLALAILGHMGKALKMDPEEILELFTDGHQSMRMNYYPPCPEPDRAIGLTPHSDADALTILFHLNETEGLQIRKHGRWIPVKPLPNALTVNLGDIMEIVSNGIYRSIEHRAVVNSDRERLSVATFYSCKSESELGPARSLISSSNRAIFKRVSVARYFKEFFAQKLDGKSYLDYMKVEQ